MPLLLNEMGAIDSLFGLLLKGLGAVAVLGLLLVVGFRQFAAPARTGGGTFGRAVLVVLAVIVVGIFFLSAIIDSL